MSAAYRHLEEEEGGKRAQHGRPASHKKPRSSSAKALVGGAAAGAPKPATTPNPFLLRGRQPALVQRPGVPAGAAPKKQPFWKNWFKSKPAAPTPKGKPTSRRLVVILGTLAVIAIVVGVVVGVVVGKSSSSSNSSNSATSSTGTTGQGVTLEGSSSGIGGGTSTGGGGGGGAGGPPPLSGFTPLTFSTSYTAGGVYFIALSSNHNMCLQIANTTGTNAYRTGTQNATIGPCNPTPWSLNQQWYYPSTTHLWINDAAGIDRYLSTPDGVTCTAGTAVGQTTSNAPEATAPATAGNGFVYNQVTQNLGTSCNTCLDSSDGVNVLLQACTEAAPQRWVFGTFGAAPSSSTGAAQQSGPPSYGNVVVADAPFLYWPLNETSGTNVKDYSGNAQMGILVNGFTYGVTVPPCCPGASGKALSWSSNSGNYIYSQTEVTNPSLPFSMEVWVAATGSANTPVMISDLGAQSQSSLSSFDNIIFINGANGNLYGGSYGNNGSGYYTFTNSLRSPFNLFDGNCHHVVLTFESSTRTDIYVDGALFIRNAPAQARNPGITGSWRLGAPEYAINEAFFNGVLSNYAIYPTLLSATQVLTHYQAAPTSTCPQWYVSSSTGS
jgi:hypothetical protein